MKIKERILNIVWLSEQGRGKVIGRATSLIMSAMTIFTFLAVYGIKISFFGIAFFICFELIVSIIAGVWYTKQGFLKTETELNNKHNPTLCAIKRNHGNQRNYIHSNNRGKRTH